MVRGALDLVRPSYFTLAYLLNGQWLIVCYLQGGVANRGTSRSKFGTKKPKKTA